MKSNLPYNVMRHREWDAAPRDPITVGNFILASIGVQTSSTFVIYAVGYLASTAITSVLMNALAPSTSSAAGNRGTIINTREPAAAQEYVYGQVRKGGNIVFMESTGEQNKFLHVVIALAGHPVEEIGDIYINDEIATIDGSGFVTGRWNSKIRIKKHDGSQTLADSDLAAETSATASFVGRDIAYIYVRLEYDQNVFAGGIPTFTPVIKGKQVENTNGVAQSYPASANAALVIRDYLKSSYGLNDSNVDDVYFASAANDCDTDILLATSGYEKRYQINCVINAGVPIGQTLQDMVTACNGTLYISGGQWRLKVGVYDTSVKSFTLDDLRSDISLQTRHSRRDNFNSVVGKFINAEDDWIEADYPAIEGAAFLDEDAGVENQLDLPLPMVTSPAQAQRVAKQVLFRSRKQMSFSADFGLRAIDVEVGDTIDLTIPDYGWNQKEFEVASWKLLIGDAGGLRINMSLRETSSAAFDWNAQESQIIGVSTTLPSVSDVPTPTLSVATASTFINADGTTIPEISFSWSVTDAARVDYYDFQWKLSTESGYKSTRVGGTTWKLSPALSTTAYDYRVRAVNHAGYRGAFASSVSPVSTGNDSTIPNAPSGVQAVGGYGSARVTWTAPTQNTDASALKDLFQYKVYRGTSANPTTLVGRVSGEGFTDTGLNDSTTYYYRVRATDFTGNESAYSSQASCTTKTAPVGATGARGAGRWTINVTNLPLTSSEAQSAFVAAVGSPVHLDQAWFVRNSDIAQSVWIYSSSTSTWTEQSEVIDGNLLVAGTLTADMIQSGVLDASKVTIKDLTIDQTLQLTAGGAGFIGGRTSASAYNENGFYIARTDKGGGAKGFEISHTSVRNSRIEGVIHKDDGGLQIFNPQFYSGGSSSGGISNITTATSVNAGETNQVTVTVVGGGGAGGYGLDNGYGSTYAASGGTTTVNVRAGSASGTIIATVSAAGGTGGENAWNNGISGAAGQATSYGLGGAAVGPNTAANSAPAVSYGAGGGGAGGDASSWIDASGGGGGGGRAGQIVTQTVDCSAYSGQDIYLQVASIGAGGVGSGGDRPGGNGAAGVVSYSSILGGTTQVGLDRMINRKIGPFTSTTAVNNTSNLSVPAAGLYLGIAYLSGSCPSQGQDGIAIVTFTLQYSVNGGTSWQTIDARNQNTTSFAYTVPFFLDLTSASTVLFRYYGNNTGAGEASSTMLFGPFA